MNVSQTIHAIKPLDQDFVRKQREYHNTLLMPEGALAVLLSYVEKLSGIYKEMPVRHLRKRAAVIFAADHGNAEEGVSAYPQEVTQQMLGGFTHDFVVITVLAKQNNLDVSVIDVGVKGSAEQNRKIVVQKIAQGTKNFLKYPAMTKSQALRAIAIGIQKALEIAKNKYDIAIVGDMGIGNTTSASAIVASLLNLAAKDVTGKGTGIRPSVQNHKISVIQKAINLHKPKQNDPIDVLTKVGGFEIAALTGFILGCAAKRIPILLDGFITGAAALLAYKFKQTAIEYCIAGHVSAEIGHKKVLERLGLLPILDLDLRLGEGSGAALALGILDNAIQISRKTATFAKAAVSGKNV